MKDQNAAMKIASDCSLLYDKQVPVEEIWCQGCMTDGSIKSGYVRHLCKIRPCVLSRNLTNCGECEDFPCEILKPSLDKVPLLEERLLKIHHLKFPHKKS